MKYSTLFFLLFFILSCENEEHLGSLPFPPTNLSAQIIDGIQIELTWKDNATNETGYFIERKNKGGEYSVIGTVNSNVTNYTDNNLPGNDTYIFRVYAFNEAGNSITYSNEVSIFFYSLKDKLHLLVLSVNEAIYEYEYKYDTLGRVIEIIQPLDDDNFLPKWSFSRNSDGQIITYNNKASRDYSEYYKYSIGNDGKYKSAQQTNNWKGYISNHNETYKYTGNLITKKSSTYKGPSENNFYTYDNNGNIKKIETIIFDSDGEYHYKVESIYDNKLFPIESLNAPFALGRAELFGDESRLFFWSKNNLLRTEYSYDQNKTGDYTIFATELRNYTYNNANKPETANVVLNDDKGNIVMHFTIKYLYY